MPGSSRAPRGQDLGQRDRDRGVAVVPARVHHARRARGEGRVEQLGERQRVDVGAPRDGAARPVAVEHAHHAGAADAGPHLELRRVQPLGDDLRGAPLLMASSGWRWKSRRSATRSSARLVISWLHSGRVLLIRALSSSRKFLRGPDAAPSPARCQPSRSLPRFEPRGDHGGNRHDRSIAANPLDLPRFPRTAPGPPLAPTLDDHGTHPAHRQPPRSRLASTSRGPRGSRSGRPASAATPSI